MSRSKFSMIVSALFVFACVVTGAAYANAAVYTNNGGQVNLFHLSGNKLAPNSNAWSLGLGTTTNRGTSLGSLDVNGEVNIGSSSPNGIVPGIATGLIWNYFCNNNQFCGFTIGNNSSGVAASADYLINDGSTTNTSYYTDFGQNGGNYDGSSYPAFAGFNLPHQTYMYNTDSAITFAAASTTAPSAFVSFLTGGGLAANERVRITSNGNVGIGSSTPLAQLQVATSTANATTSVEFGKANQTVGSCITFFSTSGAAVYMYFPGASTVPTYTATQPSGCQK